MDQNVDCRLCTCPRVQIAKKGSIVVDLTSYRLSIMPFRKILMRKIVKCHLLRRPMPLFVTRHLDRVLTRNEKFPIFLFFTLQLFETIPSWKYLKCQNSIIIFRHKAVVRGCRYYLVPLPGYDRGCRRCYLVGGWLEVDVAPLAGQRTLHADEEDPLGIVTLVRRLLCQHLPDLIVVTRVAEVKDAVAHQVNLKHQLDINYRKLLIIRLGLYMRCVSFIIGRFTSWNT